MFRLIVTASRARLTSIPSTTSRHVARFAVERPQSLAVASPSRRWASSTTLASSTTDPATADSLKALEEGTQKLEEGDVEGAKTLYKRSLEIKKTPSALFNYGVTCYHTKDFQAAIDAWKESIELQPDSPDAHTNLASAYIMMPMSRPDLALQHLRTASELSPEDAEIAFNLAAVLEASGQLEEALEQYKRSKQHGVEKADMHVRNVSAKILGKKMKEAAERENGQKP
ncbi:hypothetical protein M407DRAFT_243704 [Tulasnella calospora MUT 4182]|uniref:Uncharacterized protein n=1 Tax=Tulasnella calospora MUT 4182 TaxID=1051891 RepID=A0A0C3KYP1_9AGAM|nr:hypothetical protein M407DRAFT_243704 [Tulasnella calospora MUT 4182]